MSGSAATRAPIGAPPPRSIDCAKKWTEHLPATPFAKQRGAPMARSADPEADAEAREWIEGVIGHPLDGDSLHEGLKSGMALCE